ncbi:MAG TPA: C-terminal binding protein [Opitutaceae bacterium]
MKPPRIVITDHGFPNLDHERRIIGAAGAELVVASCKSPEQVIEAAAEADVLIVQWAPINAAVLRSLKHCRAIIRYGIGVDNVDLATARELGIAVANVPDYCIDEVADHTVTLALALGRQLLATHQRLLGGQWKITPPATMPAFREMTFAVIGLGRIGRAVLHRAGGFGFRLVAHDPMQPAWMAAKSNAQPLALDETFKAADILSLHLPLTSETRHLVSAERLASMKRTAIIVNTSRGGLIDTVALAAALEKGQVGGAGLDVFEQEPLPANHPLLSAPRTILTSHTAWFSEASVPRLQQLAAEEAVRALNGLPLLNVVNR